ncbi:MAG TPA: PilZ domain-containing protein [Candidatus Acidoferrales bacterium]|nr:PilZ domain-containing protein [Candidatus Acidoferrales bacterium]
METAVNWEELGIEANRDRRRESRIPLAIPIEVTGFDAQGKFFSDATKTVDVSERGCSFRLKQRVERGGIVAIKVVVKNRKQESEQRPFLYQVARATADGDDWIIGAAKLQPESVWYVAFPKTGEKAEAQR